MKFRRHKGEPTQPGNPYKLTRDQHIFPRMSIERFYNLDRRVSVILPWENRRLERLHSKHAIFCANRVWDQRAEAGYMAGIEREFQFLAGRVLTKDLRWWALKHDAITRFYALWELRALYSLNPVPAPTPRGVLPGKPLTKDQKELLESRHTLYADDDGTFPSRQMTGLRIQFEIDNRCMLHRNTQWQVCTAKERAGEFLVPDRPIALCIPLSPTVALVGNSDLSNADADAVRVINLTAVAGSQQFIFARDFSRCFF